MNTTKKPRVSKEEYAKQQREMQRTLLAEAVERLTTSEGWVRYLETRAKFHRYSFNNTILIALQRPDATQVAGGKSWVKKFDRKVTPEGYDKPIIILAPCMVDQKDPEGNVIMGENGKPKTRVAFYRSVKVYDISDTEGPELPTIELEPITGSTHLEYLYRCEQMATAMGYTVSYEDTGEKGGYCNIPEKKIAINIESEVNARVRTLVHELAHAHGIDYKEYSRPQAEVIVESAAYMVCQSIGLDTSGMSVPYIASWDAEDEKEKLRTLREFADTIDTLANKIEDAIS